MLHRNKPQSYSDNLYNIKCIFSTVTESFKGINLLKCRQTLNKCANFAHELTCQFFNPHMCFKVGSVVSSAHGNLPYHW